AAEMNFSDCQRQPITLPGLLEERRQSIDPLAANADCLDIDIAMSVVAAVQMRRVMIEPFVEETLAGDVVVAADDIGGRGVLGEPVEFPFACARAKEIIPE